MKKMKAPEIESKLPNMIGSGTKIVGDLHTNGDIRIDGNIDGNVNSKGKVVIGNNGYVKGEIICTNAEISGSLDGKVTATELLSLKASSKFNGEIKSGKLSIEPGAIFTGTCSMGANLNVSVPIKDEKK
ncbi:MAG TPA: polymer-forming cytoskeletal protein [Marinilabiliaceae bacterium]|nr:polymer-forming cytoskeletal protein [Marinilabiliaceae bacterium]